VRVVLLRDGGPVLDPDLRRLDASDDIMRAVAKRFGVGSLVALGILLVTGAAMASHYSRWSDNALQAKLMLLVLIGVLTAPHVITPYARALHRRLPDVRRGPLARRRAHPLTPGQGPRRATTPLRAACPKPQPRNRSFAPPFG